MFSRSDWFLCGCYISFCLFQLTIHATAKVITNETQLIKGSCTPNFFHCANGECIPMNASCNGIQDCIDDSDENHCSERTPNYHCKLGETPCRDGQCIPLQQYCDGNRNCADNSDESYTSCSRMRCPVNAFQCAYGACIEKEAICDGIRDCEDYSDETLPKCTNRTNIRVKELCGPNSFRCKSGQCIDGNQLCDGRRHCDDGSDETIKECGHRRCDNPLMYRCAYGACISGSGVCDNIPDCADASDELSCTQISRRRRVRQTDDSNTCRLPNPPKNGNYTLHEGHFAPGESVKKFTILFFTCNNNFLLDSGDTVICRDPPKWNQPFPKCKSTCPPLIEPSLEIICTFRRNPVPCNESMLNGTIATVECKQSYEVRSLPQQPFHTTICKDGKWDKILFQCDAVCGTLVPEGKAFAVNAVDAYRGEFPWHVGIYRKNSESTQLQICGGSMITANLVLTAAHCFWDYNNDQLYKPDDYSVAAGKVYRQWEHRADRYAQYNQVRDIQVPERFHAEESGYADDIAVVILSKAFRTTELVHPVCTDWANVLYKQHFKDGVFGKVAGWGLTTEGGAPAEFLQSVTLPFIPYKPCRDALPSQFRRFITPDKICAGYTNGTSVCEGDSGGGITFENKERYFIQGVVSVGPTKAGSCDSTKYTLFTTVTHHMEWLATIELDNRQTVQEVGCGADGKDPCNVDSDGEAEEEDIPGMCRPLKSSSLSIYCSKKYTTVDCSKHVPAETQAQFDCKPWYETSSEPKDNVAYCDGNAWDVQPFACQPVCGRKNPPAVNAIHQHFTGIEKLGDIPWQVGIYEKDKLNNYRQVCGGTIIGPSVVITAAHCFPEGFKSASYGVAAGAYYREWKHSDDRLAQYRNVSQILLKENYKGDADNYDNDVAIIVVTEPFTISNVVRPVCLDWQDRFERQQLVLGASAELAGWEGFKDDNKSELLSTVRGSVVPYYDCYDKASDDYRLYVTRDKICLAYTDGEETCKAENIGGITFERNGRHYLRGIIGVVPPDTTERCKLQGYTPFTRISKHLDWIRHNEIRNRPKI